MDNPVTIQVEAKTHDQLVELANKYGTSIDGVIQQLIGIKEPEQIKPAGSENENSLLSLVGIIDTDETDLSESIREVLQSDDLYDEYGFTAKKSK